MTRDDPPHDRQPDARAFGAWTQPLEELERVSASGGRDARPVVVERHDDVASLFARPDAQPARAVLSGVAHDLERGVVEEAAVAPDARQVADTDIERGGR